MVAYRGGMTLVMMLVVAMLVVCREGVEVLCRGWCNYDGDAGFCDDV